MATPSLECRSSQHAFQEALTLDRAYGLGSAMRHFGLDPKTLEAWGAVLLSCQLGLTRSAAPEPLCFVVHPSELETAPARLRHLAGTAATRFALGASVASWQNLARSQGREEIPDALWQSPRGSVAVEFDAGSYNPTQVARKFARFSLFRGGQVWATTLPARAAALRQQLPDLAPARVVLVRWH